MITYQKICSKPHLLNSTGYINRENKEGESKYITEQLKISERNERDKLVEKVPKEIYGLKINDKERFFQIESGLLIRNEYYMKFFSMIAYKYDSIIVEEAVAILTEELWKNLSFQITYKYMNQDKYWLICENVRAFLAKYVVNRCREEIRKNRSEANISLDQTVLNSLQEKGTPKTFGETFEDPEINNIEIKKEASEKYNEFITKILKTINKRNGQDQGYTSYIIVLIYLYIFKNITYEQLHHDFKEYWIMYGRVFTDGYESIRKEFSNERNFLFSLLEDLIFTYKITGFKRKNAVSNLIKILIEDQLLGIFYQVEEKQIKILRKEGNSWIQGWIKQHE